MHPSEEFILLSLGINSFIGVHAAIFVDECQHSPVSEWVRASTRFVSCVERKYISTERKLEEQNVASLSNFDVPYLNKEP